METYAEFGEKSVDAVEVEEFLRVDRRCCIHALLEFGENLIAEGIDLGLEEQPGGVLLIVFRG